ncbi:MAG: PaaI family thioesterase [Actinomycetota bacterium]
MSLQIPPNCDLTLGLRCLDKSVPGTTTWEMRADERFANPGGVIQGGFLTAMLDSSMGASAVTSLEGRRARVANAEVKVSFLRSAKVGSTLTCVATAIEAGSTVIFVEGRIRDQDDRLIATASSTYIVKDR